MRLKYLLPFTVLLLASACVVSSPGASRPCKNGACASGYQCIDNACVLVDSAGPKGDPGPAGPQGAVGPQGPAGPQGLPGVGWAFSGNDLMTTNSGNVKINGSLSVKQDLSLLPEQGCHTVYLDQPTAGDLGTQLAPFLGQFRCITVVLKANTTWTWNTVVNIAPFQTLIIAGEGYANHAQNITVTIAMTANSTFTYNGTDYRNPGRVSVDRNSYLAINGVMITESANDSRPLTPTTETGGALFGTANIGAVIDLKETIISSSEDIVGIGSQGVANILFGWTYINQATGSPRAILATKYYQGWSFGGGFGIVQNPLTDLGTGVTFQTTPKLTYTN